MGSIFNRECHCEFAGVESLVAQIAEYVELAIGDDGALQEHHLAQFGRQLKEVEIYGSDVAVETHHELFAERVDRRVCDLGKVLAEVVEENLRLTTQYCQRCVAAHRVDRLFCISSHRSHYLFDIFAMV